MLNLSRSRVSTFLALLLSFLALGAALLGVFDQNLYMVLLPTGGITELLVLGSVAQDLTSIPFTLILAFLAFQFLRSGGTKTFIAIQGLTGYFFYGYALYVLQGQYTSIYPVYLAIFSLAVFSLIYGLTSFDTNLVGRLALPKALRLTISIFLLIIVLVLGPIWLSMMIPAALSHVRPEVYGVFVLDLGIVFPALVLIASMLIQNKPFGTVLAGVALVKALTICLSVAFSESLKPLYSFTADPGSIILFGLLALFSLVLGSAYLVRLKEEAAK